MHVDLVVLSNDSLARPHQVPGRLGRLDLEHYGDVTFVDQLDRARWSVTLPRLKADVSDWVQSDKLSPVLLCLGRPVSRRHSLTILSIKKLFKD